MKAYLILDLTINDLAGFRPYIAAIPAFIRLDFADATRTVLYVMAGLLVVGLTIVGAATLSVRHLSAPTARKSGSSPASDNDASNAEGFPFRYGFGHGTGRTDPDQGTCSGSIGPDESSTITRNEMGSSTPSPTMPFASQNGRS